MPTTIAPSDPRRMTLDGVDLAMDSSAGTASTRTSTRVPLPRLSPSLLRFMGASELFSGLSQVELVGLAAAVEEVRLTTGEALPPVGSAPGRVYVVVRGAIRVCVNCEGSDRRTVSIVGKDAVFVESSNTMAGSRWGRTFSAYESSLLLSISYANLLEVARHDGRLAMNLASVLDRRVLWLQRLSSLMASAAPQQRIAACIIDLAEHHGHPTMDGATVINLRLLQRDIGDLVGVSRQVVSSTMAELRRSGILDTVRKRIVIRDERRLWQLASS